MFCRIRDTLHLVLQESECNPEPGVVTLDLKPLGNNSVREGSHTFLTSHECTQT